ncbi:MAG TPA: tetratricopeptide repeat protein, partial [Geobacteraceae bacterium]
PSWRTTPRATEVIMFLKKLFNFNRDHHYWLEKGDACLRDERFADARDAFGEALAKLESCAPGDASLLAEARRKHMECGNGLGRLNLVEAGHALNGGDARKAAEHLRTVLELAQDSALRREAEEMLAGLNTPPRVKESSQAPHSCSGCGDASHHSGGEWETTDELLDLEDRFELFIHTLPGDLAGRYKSLGEQFALGCILNRDGRGEEATELFAQLPGAAESDIVNYEMALIHYGNHDLPGCEKALRRAIDLNPLNPLSYFSLVQLFGETGRIAEALPFLNHMISNELVPDQATLLLGDAHLLLDDEQSAVECYTKVLSSPGLAKEAAAKLIPLLEKQGRGEDAAYLAKKFNKGCC